MSTLPPLQRKNSKPIPQEKLFERCELDLKNYKMEKPIKSGGYGSVYKVQDIRNGKLYAAKITKCDNENDEEEDIKENIVKEMTREVKIMLTTYHATLINFIGFSKTDFNNKRNVTIIMEFAEKGSLRDVLEKKSSQLNNTRKQIIMTGIARGIKYLHDRSIIHRDIKPENVLINKDYHPLITDFGFSKQFEINMSKNQSIFDVSNYYMAPEMHNHLPFGRKVDVYAFSIIFYEVLTNKNPFPVRGYPTIQKIIKGYRPPLENFNIKEPIKKLIEACWSDNQDNRPTFKEIFNKLAYDKDYLLDDVNIDEFNKYVEEITKDQDAVENLINQVESLEKEIEQLKEEKNSTTTKKEIDLPKEKVDTAIKERDVPKVENDKMTNETDQSKEKSDKIIKERDRLKKEKKKITRERDQLKEENDRITSERDQLKEEKERITSERDQLKAENNCINFFLQSYKNVNEYVNVDEYKKKHEILVKDKETGEIFAIKKFQMYLFKNIYNAMSLVAISRIGIPSIVTIRSYDFPEDDPSSIGSYIMDYYKNGDIVDLTNEYLSSGGNKNSKMNPTIRSKIIFGVASTLKKLHCFNFVHRHFSMEKVLLDDKLEPKIALSIFSSYLIDEKESLFQGDNFDQYRNIHMFELNNDLSLRKNNDIYSFGIFLYRMFEMPKIYNKFVEKRRKNKNLMPRKPELINDHYWDLIMKCLGNQIARPSFDEITNMLKNDNYALEEFDMETDLDQLHEYQKRINTY